MKIRYWAFLIQVFLLTLIALFFSGNLIFAKSEIRHVVIISIDGLRPDVLEIANTPNIDKLRTRGIYFPQAKTVKESWTLPGHASMLTGMLPIKHKVEWSKPYLGWPGMNGPSLLSVVHDHGMSTGMIVGKEKFNYLVLPNSVDTLFAEDVHDDTVKSKALELINKDLPDVTFIHFPDVDIVGHAFTWGSSEQIGAAAYVDGQIGEIINALEKGGYISSTLIIITADHGGHGFGHGDDSPIDRTIPWLAAGPGVVTGQVNQREINTYDTASTVLYALNIPQPEIWDGKPVIEIFQ